MIEGGVGGARTNETGLAFERQTDLKEALENAGFEVRDSVIFRSGSRVGQLLGKNAIYAFLNRLGVDWSTRVSAKLLPDEAIFVDRVNRLTIVEKKWQQVSGSVDEKLQTSGFKLRQYRKLFEGTGIEVHYRYLLSDWFTAPRYADVLEYIRESGAEYGFEAIPLEDLGLD